MKFSNTILTLTLVSSFFIGCKNTDTAPKENTAETKKEIAVAKNPQTAQLEIDGMTCQMGCAKTIEDKIAKLEGVQNVKVDFETKVATVNFDLDVLKSEDIVSAAESCADGKTYKVTNVKMGNN